MSDCRGGLSLIEALLCVTYAAWLFEHPIPKVVMKYVNAYGIIAAIIFGLCLVAIIAIAIIKKRGV